MATRRAGAGTVIIDKARARRIWLRAQELDAVAPFGAGPAAALAAVAHLGYVQIDTINVIERCHHHILFTRIPGYVRADLAHLQSADKSVFEYWTHALSYVPTADMRYYLGVMRERKRAPRGYAANVEPSELRKVLGRIRRDGPLTIRDIDDDDLVDKDHPWASRKPSKRALQRAFYGGDVVVSRRHGMLKTYELTERHFGWEKRPRPASARDVAGYLLERAIRSQGIVSLESICYLDTGRKAAVAAFIAREERGKRLVPVHIHGADGTTWWARPETLDVVLPPVDAGIVHLLSPFDPLVIQRKRLGQLFDYTHRFEAYVPKEKRVLGYFALPVLMGDAIVAAIDLKADRTAGRLLVQQWTWMDGARSAERKHLIERELGRFARFQLA